MAAKVRSAPRRRTSSLSAGPKAKGKAKCKQRRVPGDQAEAAGQGFAAKLGARRGDTSRIRKIFQAADAAGNGTISKDDLGEVLHALDPSITPSTIAILFAEADADKDGAIDYTDFIAWIFGVDRQEIAAVRLQALTRGFLGRRAATVRRQELDRTKAAEKQALQQAAERFARRELERELAAREKAAEKKRLEELAKANAAEALEAAYDNDLETVKRLLDADVPVDVRDPRSNSLISEASAGGAEDVLRLLLSRRADPNSCGEFERTPIWRAVCCGHSEVVHVLLEAGADPRRKDNDACSVIQLAEIHQPQFVELFNSLDYQHLDAQVAEYGRWTEERQHREEQRKQEAMQNEEAEYEAARAAHMSTQKRLASAKAEFREREKLHGLGLVAGSGVAFASCGVAHQAVETVEVEAALAAARFDKATLCRLEAAERCGLDLELPGRSVQVQDLNNVLVRDLGERIATSSRWPLVLDPSGCAVKLLQYGGCSVHNFWRADDMLPERLRVSLLSMIRAGGILAIDFDAFGAGVGLELLREPFEQIRAGLFEELQSRELVVWPEGSGWPRFRTLVKKSEAARFPIEAFDEQRSAKFKFALLTETVLPNQELVDAFDILRIEAPF